MPYRPPRTLPAWMVLSILLFVACSPVPEVEPITVTVPVQSQVIQRIPVPRNVRVAFGNQSIWISNPAERSISRLDANTGQRIGPALLLDFEPREIAYGEGAVWVCSADRSRLARIDPQANEVVAEVDLSSLHIPEHIYLLIAAGEGAVWITDQTTVTQIDPQTNQIVGERIPAGEEIITVALGHGTLWTGSHDDGVITRLDARTHTAVARFEVGFAIHGLAVSGEAAWALDEHGFAVVRIDPQSNQVGERVPIDFVGANLATGAGAVWVAPAARDSGQPTRNDGVARLDETKKQIVDTIHVGDMETSEYYSLYFSEDILWVLVDGPETVLVKIAP
jgi:streptogramin lyase